MDPNQTNVIDQVDEQAIVDLASELIMIPSFKPDETPVATYLAEFFGALGYRGVVAAQNHRPRTGAASYHDRRLRNVSRSAGHGIGGPRGPQGRRA